MNLTLWRYRIQRLWQSQPDPYRAVRRLSAQGQPERARLLALQLCLRSQPQQRGLIERLPFGSEKRAALAGLSLKLMQLSLREVACSSREVDEFIKEAKQHSQTHRHQGLRGALRLNFWRAPRSYQELNKLFDAQQQLQPRFQG